MNFRKNPRLISTPIVVVLLSGLIVFLWKHRRSEPVYEGRSLTSWVSDFNRGPAEYKKAREAILAIGTNSLPVLLSLLRRPEEPWQNNWIRRINRLRLVRLKPRSSLPYPDQVVSAFIVLGTNARPALPQWDRIFRSSNHGIYAAEAMTLALGRETLPYIAAGANDANAMVRSNAAVSLRNLASDPKSVAPLIVRGLADTDAGVRMRARWLADDLSRHNRSGYIDGLVATLGEREVGLKIAAIQELERLSPPGTNAISELRRAAEHSNPRVRNAALGALKPQENSPRD